MGMAKTTPRIVLAAALREGALITLGREQAHYLVGVLRLSSGDAVSVFNGTDGEWLAYLADASKKTVNIRVEKLTASVKPPPDIDFIFAPLKHARLDYMVQKATELGARRLQPVITSRTIAERVNLDRMRANVIEAAEQCNLVYVPDVLEPAKFNALLAGWDASRHIVFCDEAAQQSNPVQALTKITKPAAIFIGPEGGFTPDERAQLLALDCVTAIRLGPRIMRADTAAVAALTLVQAVLGDWHEIDTVTGTKL
jgi:16S rRNA (uracil1498-N3)-methyltransferase